MREITCIVCPRGCLLHVDTENDYAVTGNACIRGDAYGKKEVIAPSRTLTTTVRVDGAALPRVPVKSRSELPREKLTEAMKLLNRIHLRAPVRRGDPVLSDIAGTGIDIVATRDIPAL